MSWPEILSILEGELAEFEKPGVLKALRDWKSYESRDAGIDAALADESRHWSNVNEACVQFAEKRSWPKLGPEELFWIYARLDAARALVTYALKSKRTRGWVFPDSDKDVPDRSILEELLVRYWYFVGRYAYLGGVCFGQAGPFDPLADLPEPE